MNELAEVSGLHGSTIDKLKETFSLFPEVKNVLLYGSRAKGNYRTGSDIDLTIIGDELTYKHLLDIENKIEELHLPYKIDLSVFKNIENQQLIDHIQRVGVEFYSR